eukprot:7387023-Prymnesium_polylepis.1
MVPPCLLDVQPGHRVIDMCASPGSKTQQIIEALTARVDSADGADGADAPLLPGATGLEGSSLVVANDADYKRCHLLVHQAKRLHSPALVVTHHDATLIPTRMAAPAGLEEWRGDKAQHISFDRVLCDVPCSGDGTLRKSPDLWRRWGDGLALGVHRAQLGILVRGLQMLLPGGRVRSRVLAPRDTPRALRTRNCALEQHPHTLPARARSIGVAGHPHSLSTLRLKSSLSALAHLPPL